MLKSLIFFASIYLGLVIIGFIMNKLEMGLFLLVEKLSTRKIAHLVCNRLTFVGIAVHELSHAVFVVITGGKVLEIGLFDVFHGEQLGHVDFALRGGNIRRSLQLTFVSCAPVIVLGAIASVLVLFVWPIASVWWHYILLIYGLACCVCHMSMSTQDVKNYFRGLLFVFPFSWLIGFVVFWAFAPTM